MPRILFCLAFLTLVAFSNIRAQQPHGHWEHYICSNAVNMMAADGHYQWFATDGGLVKYDRLADTSYTCCPWNSAFSNLKMTEVLRDAKGAIWARAFGGLLMRLEGTSWVAHNPPKAWDLLVADSLGRLWTAGEDGLMKFDNGTWTLYDTSNAPIRDSWIEGLATDRAGNVWFSTTNVNDSAKGVLLKFDGSSSWEIHNAATDSGKHPNWYIGNILPARDGSIWATQLNTTFTLYHLHDHHWDIHLLQPTFPKGSYPDNVSRGLLEDSSGFWSITDWGAAHYSYARDTFDIIDSGKRIAFHPTGAMMDKDDLWLYGYNEQRAAMRTDTGWQVLQSIGNSTLHANLPNAMTIDSKGRYWIGDMFNATLSMFDGKTWSDYDSLVNGSYQVTALTADRNGNVYIGKSNGVLVFHDSIVKTINMHGVDSFSNAIRALLWDEGHHSLYVGNAWEGSSGYHSGVAAFDGNTWRTIVYPAVYPQVFSMAVDAAGNIWAAPYAYGIYESQGETGWRSFHQGALPGEKVMQVTADSKGGVWIASDGGPAYYDGTAWKTFSNPNIIPGVDACVIDAFGRVWFGGFPDAGNGGGVCCFDGSAWTKFSPQNSQVGSSMITSAMADAKGNVWFGTNGQGLIEFVPDATAEVTRNTAASHELRCYPNPADRSTTVEVNGASTISVIDMLGREVARVNASASTTKVQTENLPAGHYLISSEHGTMPLEVRH